MNICFYNPFNIGDSYFISFFLHQICKINKDIDFFYWTTIGSIFFENIPNLKRLVELEPSYNGNITSGEPPENFIDITVRNFLFSNGMRDVVPAKVLNFLDKDILFINTWCISEYLKHSEFCFDSAKQSYNNLIEQVNGNFGLNLKYDIPENQDIYLFYKSMKYNKIKLDNLEELNNSIFIFNYKPRTLSVDFNVLNELIINESKNNKIILSCYDSLFENNLNISFMDKTYGINTTPSCENLLKTWDIASECEKIIILPTGGSWTFFHKIEILKNKKLYMLHGERFASVLNQIISSFLGENEIRNYISSI
jgi:hypothetical protein